MQEVKDFWTPQGMHGELTLTQGADIEATIREAIRKFYKGPIIDIKYCVKNRDDQTELVYFEILD